jgi:diadenosine tetraphosphatase ApaH/serine/threonine PP2A family protein phosphatase/Ca2+-binding EF-hand superfamily protein
MKLSNRKSSTTTPSSSPSSSPGPNASATATESSNERRPVLRRARNFVGLPPLFAEAWGALEELEEQELMANATDAKTTKVKTKLALRRKQRRTNLLSGVTLKSVVPATYRGPKLQADPSSSEESLTPKVNMEFVLQLINAYKNGIDLHYSYAHYIISTLTRYLEHEESTVMDITLPEDGSMVVVGDLHGQLDDLLTIFRLKEFPSPTNFYLFNGDLVDRGDHSVEVLLIVYALKLVYPKCVFINRGNHEHRLMNARYRFELQVKQKYDEALYELIQTSFNWLPLAAVVEDSTFIVHGGLPQFEDFTIEELRSISRRDLLPHPLVHTREDMILEQLLWSDPGKGGRAFMSNRRGAGILFSADITRNFLKRNNLVLVVRSHQMVDAGYSRCHNGTMVTIFSASNYCNTNMNMGAVAVFDAKSGKLQFVQYEADKNLLAFAPGLSKDNLDPKIVAANAQRDETLEKLTERILRKRHALYLAFAQLDKKTGFVTLNDWASVMTMVIRIDLHWQALWPFLGYKIESESEKNSEDSLANASVPEFINYTKFLDQYTTVVDKKVARVLARKQSVLVDKLCRKFYEKSLDLKQVFDSMDKDGDGKISYDIFCGGLRRFKRALGLDGGQLYDLMRSVDRDQDGLVRWKDFLDRFSIRFDAISEVPEEHKQFLLDALTELANAIYRKRGLNDAIKMKKMFRSLAQTDRPMSPNSISSSITASGSLDSVRWESLKDVTLTFEEFYHALKREIPRYRWNRTETRVIFDYMDRDRDGNLGYFEFRRCFKFGDKESDKWAGAAIAAEIQNNRNKLLKVFVEMDVEGSGKVPLGDFKTVFNTLLGKALEEEEARVLGETTTDVPDTVDYHTFLRSFKASKN